MGGRGGSPSPSALGQAQKKAAARNETGFDTGDQELNELLDVFYDTPGYMIGVFNGVPVINYEPNPDLPRDADGTITLRDLRQGLARKYGWGFEKQEAAFRRLQREGQIQMFPLAKQLALTQAMRNAGLQMGGENKTGALLNRARRYKRSN